jgi:hypothetical protein|tara:strand:+ start:1339 stop:1554 length:216 start_codon:yes stop_codon:yes gene_type:complete
MLKRSNFYPNGEIIDYRLPQTFQPTKQKQACGNCAFYSGFRRFCAGYKCFGVRDNYICHSYRPRRIKRERF